jgi:alpha-ketoglutarate-dependent taurine dioxygenase
MENATFLDINLKDLTDAEITRLATLTAYATNVIIKHQELSKIEYSRILQLWGQNPERDHKETWFVDEAHPEITLVTNKFEVGKENKQGLFARGELGWHQNGTLTLDPEDCVTIYCQQPTEKPCDTSFVNGVIAFNELPIDVKKQIENTLIILSSDARSFHKLKLNHLVKTKLKPRILCDERVYKIQEDGISISEQRDLLKLQSRVRTEDSVIIKEMMNRKEQFNDPKGVWNCVYKKLTHKHRLTGVNGLYFPFSNVIGFHDIPQDEWQELHTFLTNHYLKYRYIHRWDQGDLVLFDNTQGLHKREDIPLDRNGEPQPRELWRGAFWYNGIA